MCVLFLRSVFAPVADDIAPCAQVEMKCDSEVFAGYAGLRVWRSRFFSFMDDGGVFAIVCLDRI